MRTLEACRKLLENDHGLIILTISGKEESGLASMVSVTIWMFRLVIPRNIGSSLRPHTCQHLLYPIAYSTPKISCFTASRYWIISASSGSKAE